MFFESLACYILFYFIYPLTSLCCCYYTFKKIPKDEEEARILEFGEVVS